MTPASPSTTAFIERFVQRFKNAATDHTSAPDVINKPNESDFGDAKFCVYDHTTSWRIADDLSKPDKEHRQNVLMSNCSVESDVEIVQFTDIDRGVYDWIELATFLHARFPKLQALLITQNYSSMFERYKSAPQLAIEEQFVQFLAAIPLRLLVVDTYQCTEWLFDRQFLIDRCYPPPPPQGFPAGRPTSARARDTGRT